MNVFISYRRDDSALAAKLLHEELARHFGAEHVFMDIEDIGYGDDFVARIGSHLDEADVMVVVIGPRWLEILQARLGGDDWVREEVRRALARRDATGAPRVIAALVDGAAEPVAGLPEELRPLAASNMLRINPRALNESLNALAEAVQGRRFSSVADELKRRQRLRIAAAVAGLAVFFGGWVSVFDLLGLDTRAATATMLLSSALPGAPSPPWSGEVVLAAIDGKTVAAVGREFGPTWRAEHAQFLRRAAEAGARTVAFDITFAAEGPDAADAALAAALAEVRERLPVIVGVHEIRGATPVIAPRFAPLAHWGIACAGDRLGVARLMPLVVERPAAAAATTPAVMPSLALAAVAAGAPVVAPDRVLRQLRLQRGGRELTLRFQAFERVTRPQVACPAIQPGDFVASQLFDPAALPPLDRPPQRVAYEDVLRGDAAALALLKDRIVLVGVQLPQEDRTAIAGGGERWGVDLHAAQIDALLRGATISPLPWAAQAGLAVALAVAGAFTAARLRSRPAAVRALAIAALGGTFIAASVLLYRADRSLVGIAYGLVALALGAWMAGRFLPRGLR
jgi:CHASE2 domain-containing sensor protein